MPDAVSNGTEFIDTRDGGSYLPHVVADPTLGSRQPAGRGHARVRRR